MTELSSVPSHIVGKVESELDQLFQQGMSDAGTIPLAKAQAKHEEGTIAHKWYMRGWWLQSIKTHWKHHSELSQACHEEEETPPNKIPPAKPEETTRRRFW